MPPGLHGVFAVLPAGLISRGTGARGATPGKSWALPESWDLITVCICCLIIFHWAVSLRVNSEHVAEMVAAEDEEIRAQPDLNVA